jgi:hypothetical protein
MQIPELLKRLHDGKPMTRHAAARALGRMGPLASTPEVLRALSERLGDVEDVRRAAAWALGRIGLDGAPPDVRSEVLNSVLTHLRHEDEDIRRAAAWALARMSGATRPEVIEVLTDALLRGV